MAAQGMSTTISAHTQTQESGAMIHVNSTTITIHHITQVVTTRIAQPQPIAYPQSIAYLRPFNAGERHNAGITGRVLRVSRMQLLHIR